MVACEYVQSLRAGFTRCAILLAPVLALTGGCASAPIKPPEPVEMLDTWNNNVRFLPDPCNGGRRTPALLGRVYLMDEKGNVIMPEEPGTLMVQVFEEHPRIGADGNPMALEAWRITPECMKQYASKDVIGGGYNVAVPWNTYRPDISRVEFKVSYTPKDPKSSALPLYGPGNNLMTFQNSGGGMTGTATANGNQMQPHMPPSGYAQGPMQPMNGNQASTMQINAGPQPGSVQVTTNGPPVSLPANNHFGPPAMQPNVGASQSMLPPNNVGNPGLQQVSNFGPSQPVPSVVTIPQISQPPSEPQPSSNTGDQVPLRRTVFGMPSSPGMEQPAPQPQYVPPQTQGQYNLIGER